MRPFGTIPVRHATATVDDSAMGTPGKPFIALKITANGKTIAQANGTLFPSGKNIDTGEHIHSFKLTSSIKSGSIEITVECSALSQK